MADQPDGELNRNSHLWDEVCWLTLCDSNSALFEAVRESNRSKVSALAEDNWMFEPEEQPRIS